MCRRNSTSASHKANTKKPIKHNSTNTQHNTKQTKQKIVPTKKQYIRSTGANTINWGEKNCG